MQSFRYFRRITNRDELYMLKCLELAGRGFGSVSPNPMVGCVILKDDRVIAEAFHEAFGKPHAEAAAISKIEDQELLKEATVYVNLEPCAHFGKTPPCADLLVEKKVKRVVIGHADPNPLVAGKGIEKLRQAGIEVVLDVLKEELPDIDNIDVLIYCPGSINLKPIANLSVDDFRNDFETNVIGAVKAIQKYLPVLKKGNQPSVILFSTVAVKLGMPFHASIATAKAGIEGLVKSLGAELASLVRINAIAPTITETSLSASILRNDRMKENMMERHPMKNYLKPDEVANMVDFLISDKARSISGQIFEMDYGLVTFKM